jgi:hypothetical protein
LAEVPRATMYRQRIAKTLEEAGAENFLLCRWHFSRLQWSMPKTTVGSACEGEIATINIGF